MLVIYFSSDKEVIHFCEHLFCHNKHIELYWKNNEEWGSQLQFSNRIINDETTEAIANSLVHLFIEHRLPELLREMIETYFYYTNQDEVDRILNLTEWIFSGKDNNSLQIRGKEDPQKLLNAVFRESINEKTTIHFDSIVQFRLKSFQNKIIEYIGFAIDEFKREEDHQMFINMLREFIENKEAKYHDIHIVQGDIFTFFKSNGERFSNMELKLIMHEEPLYIVGLDDKEFNLAPLVALAPEKITIYGDNPSESKTLTIINVFQERVVLKPYREFPFQHSLKKRY